MEDLDLDCINKERQCKLELLWEDEEYVEFFLSLDKVYLVMTMVDRWEDIPDQNKYEIFCHVYSFIESGFEEITDEILEDVCRLRPELSAEVVKRLNDGKIFRGDVKGRTQPEQSLSWTLSLKVADYYSNRFVVLSNKAPIIWSAKVDPKDVVAYITDRKEDEIIVKRGAVTDITSII